MRHVLAALIAAAMWLGDGAAFPGLASAPQEAPDPRRSLPHSLIAPPPDPDSPSSDERPPGTALSPAEAPRLLLPDLRTLPPYDLEIDTLLDGSRELRLSNTIWNSGAGALELEGEFNSVTRKTRVVQHIHARAGTQRDHLVGEFIWHSQHDHWHFEDFSIYELWTLTPTGGLKSVVSSSDKLSYCLIDTDIIDSQKEGFSPLRRYYGCGRTLQGLSAGWGDTYKSHLDGQSIRLAGIKDGFYALKSTANPDAILLEARYDNNAALLYLEIRGQSLELIDPADYVEQRCQEDDWWVSQAIVCSI